MTIHYTGQRDNNSVGGFCTGKRFAELTCTEDEREKFASCISSLRAFGWIVDDGVDCWALVEVENKREFDSLNRDWKKAKHSLT